MCALWKSRTLRDCKWQSSDLRDRSFIFEPKREYRGHRTTNGDSLLWLRNIFTTSELMNISHLNIITEQSLWSSEFWTVPFIRTTRPHTNKHCKLKNCWLFRSKIENEWSDQMFTTDGESAIMTLHRVLSLKRILISIELLFSVTLIMTAEFAELFYSFFHTDIHTRPTLSKICIRPEFTQNLYRHMKKRSEGK